ncbi:glycosyl transferase, family 14 protein [Tanacetum coccineum]
MMRGKGANDEFVFKDSSIGLMRLLCFLILLVTGIIIGLTCSSHVDRYFYISSQPDNFYVNYVSAAPAPSYSTSIAKDVKPVSFDNNCSSGMTSCKEDCLSMEGFKMPNNLTHKMTDNELFWRASLVPNKAEYPFERVPKVAFMFMTRGPLPFLKLWERFFKGQDVNKYSIYVHTNPGVRMNFSNSSVFYNRVIPSQDVRWGTVTLVDAERRLLGNALLDFSNERFVLLSESCIPILKLPLNLYNYCDSVTQKKLPRRFDEPLRYGQHRPDASTVDT